MKLIGQTIAATFLISIVQESKQDINSIDSSNSWISSWCRFPPTAVTYDFCEEFKNGVISSDHLPNNGSNNVDRGADFEYPKVLHITMHSGAKWELVGISKALGIQV
jgi:hypothetical protein